VICPATQTPTPKFTSVDVGKLIKKLEQEKVSGIILDLRKQSRRFARKKPSSLPAFHQKRPVVLARSLDGSVNVDSDTDASVLYNGPLVVLVNRLSASASEIATAALQD